MGYQLGYLMATYTDLGPYGYWIGLIVGLTIGAITLASRLRYIQKRNSCKQLKPAVATISFAGF